MNKRAVGYVRLSQKERKLSKDEIETSIINQENEIRNYCKLHKYDLIKIYREKYMTGDSPNRPSFNQMRDDAINREFDVIIVRSMSRFTREGADKQEDLLIEFTLNKVEVISMTEETGDELTRYMLGMVNKIIIIMGRIKTRQMRKGKKADGRAYIKAPYGYKNIKKKKTYWQINPKEAEIVKRIFNGEKYNDSLGISKKVYNKIRNNINYVGVNGKSILCHNVYIRDSKKKIVDVQKEIYYGYHEPIISPQEWLKIHPEDKDNEFVSGLL